MRPTQESVFTLRYIPALGVSFFARALLSMRCPRMPIRIQIIIQVIMIINCNGNDFFSKTMLLVVASARWESGFVGFACIGTEWEQSEQELQACE